MGKGAKDAARGGVGANRRQYMYHVSQF